MDDLVIYKKEGKVFGSGFRLNDMGLKGLASIEGDSEVSKLLDNLYVPAGLFVSPIKRDKSEYFKGNLYDNIQSLCPKTKKRRTTTNRRTKKRR